MKPAIESKAGNLEQKSYPTIPYGRQKIFPEDITSVEEVLRSERLTQGPVVEKFEHGLAESVGAVDAVAVSNGSVALHLAMRALDVGPGDVGIVPAITFAATANALVHVGATPVFADVDPETGVVTSDTVEEALDNALALGVQPKVILPVSLAGRTPRLHRIRDLARGVRCRVVEDAAHSIGGHYEILKGAMPSASCNDTDLAILSFHPVKGICSGEGGAVTVRDPELAQKIRLLRSHGIRRPSNAEKSERGLPDWYYEQVDLGYNYRMSDIHAALGNSQLRRLGSFVFQRAKLAKHYRTRLVEEPYSRLITLPPHARGHAYHLFVVHFPDERIRNQAHSFLAGRGIQTQVHYLPLYRHPYFAERFPQPNLPGAEAYFNGCLSLPLYVGMTAEEFDRIMESLAAFCRAV